MSQSFERRMLAAMETGISPVCFPLKDFPTERYNQFTCQHPEYDFDTKIVHGDLKADGYHDPNSPHGVQMVSFKSNNYLEVKALEKKHAAEALALCTLYEMMLQGVNARSIPMGDGSPMAHYTAAVGIFHAKNTHFVAMVAGQPRDSHFMVSVVKRA